MSVVEALVTRRLGLNVVYPQLSVSGMMQSSFALVHLKCDPTRILKKVFLRCETELFELDNIVLSTLINFINNF